MLTKAPHFDFHLHKEVVERPFEVFSTACGNVRALV